jgi:hypothetical protein
MELRTMGCGWIRTNPNNFGQSIFGTLSLNPSEDLRFSPARVTAEEKRFWEVFLFSHRVERASARFEHAT